MSVDLVYLFVLHMFFKYNISFYITSNRGLEFVLKFFYSLGTTLDIELCFTLDYYSNSNGQTEYTNQTLEQYFCVYCNY